MGTERRLHTMWHQSSTGGAMPALVSMWHRFVIGGFCRSMWHRRLAGVSSLLVCTAMLLTANRVFAVEIPAAQRIEARVVTTLVAPAGSPMQMPTDIAVDTQGRTFVADGVNHRIVRFTAQGAYDGNMTTLGDLRLSCPVGLTCDAAGHVWIADTGLHRVIVVSATGELTHSIDLPPAPDGTPFDPTDVALSPDGKRACIVDNDHHRVLLRDNATGQATLLGRFGRGLGEFEWPYMTAIDGDGTILITEAIGARVQRITADAQWAGQISRWGVQPGELYRPKGVATDGGARVFVSDSTLSVVQVFALRGRFLGVLTNANGEPLRFAHPMGMAFAGGRLYVVECRANRVAVITIGDESSAQAATTKPAGGAN